MALELQISKGALDSTNGTLVISDSTGAYNADTNLTGYGTPNPARAAVAIFLRAYNNRYEGEDEVTGTLLTATPDDTDPIATTLWTLTLAEEGWIKATIYGVRLLDVATELEVDEIVWDADNSVLKRILTVTGDGPYTFTTEDAVEADLENEDYHIAYSTVLNTYAIPELCECYLKSVQAYLLDIEDENLRALSEKIRAYLVAIRDLFLTDSPADAQKLVEKAESLCECLDSNCIC
jgi:hypothetical protein